MWISIQAHIYPHLSKVKLLLETNGGINEQYLQWVPYMPGTTVHDVPLLVYGTGRKAYLRAYGMPFIKMVSGGGSQRSPRSPGDP